MYSLVETIKLSSQNWLTAISVVATYENWNVEMSDEFLVFPVHTKSRVLPIFSGQIVIETAYCVSGFKAWKFN